MLSWGGVPCQGGVSAARHGHRPTANKVTPSQACSSDRRCIRLSCGCSLFDGVVVRTRLSGKLLPSELWRTAPAGKHDEYIPSEKTLHAGAFICFAVFEALFNASILTLSWQIYIVESHGAQTVCAHALQPAASRHTHGNCKAPLHIQSSELSNVLGGIAGRPTAGASLGGGFRGRRCRLAAAPSGLAGLAGRRSRGRFGVLIVSQ